MARINERGHQILMRYGLMIGNKRAAIKAAMEGNYRWIMLAMMGAELALLALLVVLEILHR